MLQLSVSTIVNLIGHNQNEDLTIYIVKLWSRSKVYLKSLRDLDLELEAIIAMSPPTTHHETFLSRITLKSLHV